jgi:IS30 family transposase
VAARNVAARSARVIAETINISITVRVHMCNLCFNSALSFYAKSKDVLSIRCNTIIDLLQLVSDVLYTLAADNCKEFAEHEKVTQELKVDFFFAYPYAPWERSTNKTMNGLVRQYIPKNRNLAPVKVIEVELIMHRLNNRLRKYLDYLSPFEVFCDQPVALSS